MMSDVAVFPSLRDEMKSVVANLEQREWIQGEMQLGEAVCAHGAVMTCQGLRPGDKEIIRAVMRAKGVTESWNDMDGRLKQEVLARMVLIEVTDADLELAFGPSWRLVVAVIRRAAVLTPEEAKDMAAAWGAAWGVAWAAAGAASRAAARDASRGAARDAAWGVAWAAARGAARDAARDAARSVCVTDLVGQHGLTQEHIDTLMGPWVQVLGENWADGMVQE